MSLTTCIGCGCDDDNACLDQATGQGCSWLRVDRNAGLGVCSCCGNHVSRWDRGDRNPTAEAFATVAARYDEEDGGEALEREAAEAPRIILPGDPGYFL